LIECRERARLAAKTCGLDGSIILGSLTKSEIRIFNIAQELVGNPTFICLIDPLEGLDANGKTEVLKVLWTIAKRVGMGTTILFNLHSIDEDCLRFIDNVAIFFHNRLDYLGNLKNLKSLKSPISSSSTTVTTNIFSKISDLFSQLSLLLIDLERTKSEQNSVVNYNAIINLYETSFKAIVTQLVMLDPYCNKNDLKFLTTSNTSSNEESKRSISMDSTSVASLHSVDDDDDDDDEYYNANHNSNDNNPNNDVGDDEVKHVNDSFIYKSFF
jgi:ABC-type multidrug transport system ATPase subunit